MSQRASGYERKELDLYQTPAWVVDALAEHVPLRGRTIWERAAPFNPYAFGEAVYP